jgi:uncharacterized GH25 family protein
MRAVPPCSARSSPWGAGGGAGFADFLSSSALARPGKREASEGSTDTAGRFRFDPVRAGKWTLRIDHPLYKRAIATVEVGAGEEHSLDPIRLETGRRIEGRVVDEQGRGLVGASVSPQMRHRSGGNVSVGYSERRAVTTGANGNFVLGGIGDQLRVRVECDGYRALVDHPVPLDQGPVTITLKKGRVLAGRVLATEGVALDGAQVHVRRDAGARQGGIQLLTPPRRVDCESDGSFVVEELEPGSYTLRAELPGYGISSELSVELSQDGRNDIVLRLEKGPTLTLQVQDVRGTPVPGALVELGFVGEAMAALPTGQARPRGVRSSLRRSANTGVDGTVTFEGLWRGLTSLSVESKGYLRYEQELALSASDLTQRVQLVQGGTIEGIAYSADGSPLSGAEIVIERAKENAPSGTREVRVEARSIRFGPSQRVTTDADGRFRSHALESGAYRVGLAKKNKPQQFGGGSGFVMVGAPGQLDEASAVDALVTVGQATQVTIRQVVLGGIRGVVVGGGAPVPNARVFAHVEGGDAFESVEAKADGAGGFVLADMNPGTYLLSAKPAGGKVASPRQKVVVPPGGAFAQARVELGGARVRGYVVPPNSRSPRGLEVSLQKIGAAIEERRMAIAIMDSETGTPRMSTMTQRPPSAPEPILLQDDGRFDFRHVPAGDWVVLVRHSDGSRLARRDVELSERSDKDLGAIELEPSWPISLRIRDQSGQPIQMGGISVRKWSAEGEPRGVSVFNGGIRQGSVEIGAISAGRYTVELRLYGPAGASEPQTGEFTVNESGQVTGGTLTLRTQ